MARRKGKPFFTGNSYATSHVRAVLGPAEELLWWDAAAAAVAKNRLALAGMVGFPSNLESPTETEEDVRFTGSQRFILKWMKTAAAAISNPTGPEAAVPLAYTYPYNEQGKSGIDVTEFSRPQDVLLENRTERSLLRIEQGINLPTGVISGLGNSSHWNSSQIEESVFRDHVEPLVLLICSALTRAYLLPILAAEGVPDDELGKYFVWYDASNLIVHRDRPVNALRAYELGLISDPAARRELGYSEHDKPTKEQRDDTIFWITAVRRGMAEAILPNDTDRIPNPDDPNAPPSQNAPGDRTPSTDQSPITRGRGQDPVQASANGHVSLLIHQLQVLCDEKIRRSLERAGNRIRNRAKKVPNYFAAVERVPATHVAATLGQEAVIELGATDLFHDAFSDLIPRIIALAPATLDANVLARAGEELTTALRAECARCLYSPPTPDLTINPAIIEEAFTKAGLKV